MRWEIANKKYDDIILQILSNRGIIEGEADRETASNFLEPNFERDFFNPELLPDYQKVVGKIIEAKENNLKIGIFADYDADGIPGAALLSKALEALGIKSEVYIPNRESGYGLSRSGIDFLVHANCEIVITVDLGIRNFDEAAYAKEIGICLIITDHHEPDKKLPGAYAVMNPKNPESKYPFRELSGAGVIFKLIWGLSKAYPKELPESFIKWNLDLPAISTISDVVPLTGENRVIAKFGLLVLSKTKNLGLNALYEVAGIDPKKINSYTVGFQIGPRINAPGRLDHATKSFVLLTTKDKGEAQALAKSLNETNEKRQEEMQKLERHAEKIIEKENLLANNAIVIAGDWHKGVLGPSASHLIEKFNRPVIIFSDRSDPYVGSARGISGLNLIEILEKCQDDIERFGGHKGAAGLAVKKANFKKFAFAFIDKCKSLPAELFVKKARVDVEIKASDLRLSLASRLKQLEPFGMGNPRPVFMLSGVKFSDIRCVGKDGAHLSFRLIVGEKKIKAIYFNCSLKLKTDILYDMIFTLDEDFWNGKNYLNINAVDIREHGKKE